jgi:hypothetical protein
MTSVKEARISSHSNHNMEYLALLATIFLPVTLVTVDRPLESNFNLSRVLSR